MRALGLAQLVTGGVTSARDDVSALCWALLAVAAHVSFIHP